MLETIFTSILSFVGTNIDDIFINTFFFAQADTKRKVQSVIIGKYIGIGFLVLLSFLGAYFLHTIPQNYVGFLGFVPIFLGIKEWFHYLKNKNQSVHGDLEETTELSSSLTLSVALVTISSGADNIGVYIPLFITYTALQMITLVIIFIGMIALWCLLSKKLSDLPGLRKFLLRYKYVIVPMVLILLGIYIFAKSI